MSSAEACRIEWKDAFYEHIKCVHGDVTITLVIFLCEALLYGSIRSLSALVVSSIQKLSCPVFVVMKFHVELVNE